MSDFILSIVCSIFEIINFIIFKLGRFCLFIFCSSTRINDNGRGEVFNDIDMVFFRYHQRAIAINHLRLMMSEPFFIKRHSKLQVLGEVHDVRLYLLVHMGCYYNTVAHIIAKHKTKTTFYVPLAIGLSGSWIEKHIKRLSAFGHSIITGPIDDKNFLLSMYKSILKDKHSKIIIFIDLPRVASPTSASYEHIFFGRKASFISGYLHIIKKFKVDACAVSSSYGLKRTEIISFSDILHYEDKDINSKAIKFIETSILSSPYDWKYLSIVEFYYHFYRMKI
ncbi:hypothetical protein ACET9P_22055 [Aeromonas veronii]